MFGHAIHAALADYFGKPASARSQGRLETAFRESWVTTMDGLANRLGDEWIQENQPKLADAYKRGLAALGKFWNLSQNSPHMPVCKVETEVQMEIPNAPKPPFLFRAIPDAYFVTDARIVILSHKSSPWSQPDRSGNLMMNPQHLREALVLSKLHPGKPIFVRYYFLWPSGSDTREIPILPGQLAQAYGDLREIAERREVLAKQQRPTWNLRPMCERNCDYARICLARVQLWDVKAEKERWYAVEGSADPKGAAETDDTEASA